MKVLFYSTYHFNTEVFGPLLEQMQAHLNSGNEVYFLSCNGELSSCQTNPLHSKIKCSACVNFRKNGVNCLNGKVTHISIEDVLDLKEIDTQKNLIDLSSIENFKKAKFEKFDIGLSVLSSVVSITRDPKIDLNLYKNIITKQWESSVWVYETVKKIIDNNQINLVYVFNARFSTLRAALRAAEFKNINCNVLEEGRDRKSYSIFPNVMPHSIEYYHSMTKEIWENAPDNKEEIAWEYLKQRSESKNARVGFFTEEQKKGLLPQNWDDSKINIAIFTSSEDEFVAIGEEWESDIYKSQVDGVKKIIDSLSKNKNYHIYVRLHPNLKGLVNKSITDLIDINEENATIIIPTSPISTYDLMKQADRVITFGSSVAIEATAFDKVSILAGKSLYMNLGSTYNPSNHEELMQIVLDKNVEPKPKLGTYMFAYMLANFGYDYKYFKRIDTFSAFMNEKKLSFSFIYITIRKIGRWIRIKKENWRKNKNNSLINELHISK